MYLSLLYFEGFFELQTTRDHYRSVLEAKQIPFHRDLILRFIEVQALLITPICPHLAEKMWKMLGKEGFIVQARWPQGGNIDHVVLAQDAYLEDIIYEFRNKISNYKRTKAKDRTAKVRSIFVFYCSCYNSVIRLLRHTSMFLPLCRNGERKPLPICKASTSTDLSLLTPRSSIISNKTPSWCRTSRKSCLS